jgi:hypothetical protein
MTNPFGSFTQEALEAYQKALAEREGTDFAEGDLYDFTTCIRPDGSSYGTSGKCRKGSEGEAKAKAKAKDKPKKGGSAAPAGSSQVNVEAAKAERKKASDELAEISKRRDPQGKLSPEDFQRSKDLGNKMTEMDMMIDKGLGGTQWKRYEKGVGVTLSNV